MPLSPPTVGCVAWFFVYGIIIDRISVALSVALFLVIGHIATPWSAWRAPPFGLLVDAAMWLAHDDTRGAAHLVVQVRIQAATHCERREHRVPGTAATLASELGGCRGCSPARFMIEVGGAVADSGRPI